MNLYKQVISEILSGLGIAFLLAVFCVLIGAVILGMFFAVEYLIGFVFP